MHAGPIVITLFLAGALVAEHYLADILYSSLEKRCSKEYVRRQRISSKVSGLLILGFIWAIALDKDFRFLSNQLFWLLGLAMIILGVWTLHGWRKKN